MRAEFWIEHSGFEPGPLRMHFEKVFGTHDPGALVASEIFQEKTWQPMVLFCIQQPSYRLVCFQSTAKELQAHVEPTGGNMLQTAESAWRGIKNALEEGSPKLATVKLIDNATNREFMSGRTGLKTEILRRETLGPIVVALVVLIYSVVGALTFASSDPGKFLLGAVGGIVAGFVSVIFAVRDARNGVIRWSGTTTSGG